MSSNEDNVECYKSKYSFISLSTFFKKQNLKPLKEIDNEAIIDFFTIYNIKDVILESLILKIFKENRNIPLPIGTISKCFQCFMCGWVKYFKTRTVK